MKEIIITVPDNCELKQDGNTYTIIEREDKLTYDDIAKKLFSRSCFYIDSYGGIKSVNCLNSNITDLTNCTSEKQAEKLLAINKLMNVAKYLNGGWQPDWNKHDYKFYIHIDSEISGIHINCFNCNVTDRSLNIYFKSKELAQQAIEILGEDTIKLALCTDY